MAIIEIKSLDKFYGKKIIFKNFSMSVEPGDLVAITGNSGCGKSTLLNIIGLLEDYNHGEIVIDGKRGLHPNSKAANKMLREVISYLFQNFALVDDETVLYNLNLALKYVKSSKFQKQKQIENALQKVGLTGYENKKIYRLSGGEQQRVAIARILLKPSKIILADEPTGSLDHYNRDIVIEMLKEINKQGKTIIIVTHDDYVAQHCHKVINLN